MKYECLREVDLEGHCRILEAVAGHGYVLRFDDLDGLILYASSGPVDEPHLPMTSLGMTPIDGISRWRQDGDNAFALRRCLNVGAVAEPVWLTLVATVDSLGEAGLLKLFDRISCLVAAASAQAEVLMGMSNELATRYEELNFVYELDQRRVENPANTQAALTELATATRAHLELGLVLVYIPDQDLCLDIAGADCDLGRDERRRLAHALLEFLATDPTTLVLNRDHVIDWSRSDLAPDYKLCATPIRLDGQSHAGVLVFANPVLRTHFTNSDRRMCEVVAAEIAKIVQHSRDHLTGALNRRGLEALLEDLLQVPPNGDCRALLVIDIDSFQMLNGQIGMAGADDLLRHVAQVLPRLDPRVTARVARIGADEFALLLEMASRSFVEAFAARIGQALKQLAFFHQGQAIEMSVSIGGAIIDADTIDPAAVFGVADVSLREAKGHGGNAVVVHAASDPEISQQREEIDIASVLKASLKENRFELFAQAITAVAKDDVPYFEVLLRLRDEHGGMLSPGVFIPVAERFNLMPDIDRWVIEHAIRALSGHLAGGGRPFRISVNVSGQSMTSISIADAIIGWLAEYAVPTDLLVVEVTETSAIANLTSGLEILHRLRGAGCRIALDDFGSGMSSFGYLRNLPVDVVKIDGSFVRRMTSNAFDRTFVDVINRLAHAMELRTVAEFVEDQATWAILRDFRIDYVQGYFFDKPAPLAQKIDAMTTVATPPLAHAG